MKKSLLLAVGLPAMVSFGAYAAESVPFSENFNNLTDFRTGWTTVDVNNDGRTWKPYFNEACAQADFGATTDLEDWLFTPGITLEAGKTYVLEFGCAFGYMFSNQVYPSLKVGYGLSQTPEGMTHELLPTTVQQQYFTTEVQRFVLTPETSGDYYFGFLATGSQVGGIKLDNVAVKEATMPAAVTEFTVTKSETYGDSHVQVSFRAPDKAVSGAPIQALQKIEVVRSGINVKTIENPTPGEVISFEDNCTFGSGNYVWKATAYGEDGQQGLSAESKNVFVGVNAPANPTNVNITEEGNSGMLTLSWDPVTTDRDGTPMPAEFIDYQVIFNGSYIVETGATSPFTFKACEPEEQTFVHASVVAKSNYGSGVTPTDVFIAGKPYTEYHESFDNCETKHVMEQKITDKEKPAELHVYDNAILYMSLGLESDADGSNGCVAIISQYTGYSAGMSIGKFDLSNIDNPYLTFFTHYGAPQNGVNMKNLVTVYANTGNGFEEILKYDMDAHNGLVGWQRVEVPLADLKGSNVELMLKGTVINSPYILFDNISIVDFKDKNLTARSISVPGETTPGQDFFVHGFIENTGKEATPMADALLLLDGEEVAAAKVEALEPGANTTVSFSQKLTLLHPENNVYTISLVYADDMNADDNISAGAIVKNLLPKFPAAESLKADKKEVNTVELTWSEPTGEMLPEEMTESFEDATDFAHSFGDWTFIDNDGKAPGNYDNLPGLDDYSGPFIANGTNYMNFTANTGNKTLAFIAAEEDGTADDWAISPLLSGDAQTVKFYARGYDTYGYVYESFRFLTSTTGKEIADFTEVTTDQNLSMIGGKTWTEFTFDLPEGTKYFAINYAPDYGIALRVDDVTFTPGDSGDPLELLGYNVYRNGDKLNSETVTGLTFTDTEVPAGNHTYHVTALYNRGESRGSNPAEVSFAVSLDKVEASGITVKGGEGEIAVTTAGNAVNILVMTADGRTVASAVAEGTLRIPAAAGIYLVATPAGTVKVAVK